MDFYGMTWGRISLTTNVCDFYQFKEGILTLKTLEERVDTIEMVSQGCGL